MSAEEKSNLQTFFRGTWNAQAEAIVENGSAGGAKRNVDAEKVSVDATKQQVGNNEGVQKTPARALSSFKSLVRLDSMNIKVTIPPHTAAEKEVLRTEIDKTMPPGKERDDLLKKVDDLPMKEIDPNAPVEYTDRETIARNFAQSKDTESVVMAKIDPRAFGRPGSQLESERGTVFSNETPVYSPRILPNNSNDFLSQYNDSNAARSGSESDFGFFSGAGSFGAGSSDLGGSGYGSGGGFPPVSEAPSFRGGELPSLGEEDSYESSDDNNSLPPGHLPSLMEEASYESSDDNKPMSPGGATPLQQGSSHNSGLPDSASPIADSSSVNAGGQIDTVSPNLGDTGPVVQQPSNDVQPDAMESQDQQQVDTDQRNAVMQSIASVLSFCLNLFGNSNVTDNPNSSSH